MSINELAFFQNYYSALKQVDNQYQQLEAAKLELTWYEALLKEADGQAVQNGFGKASEISVLDGLLPERLDRTTAQQIFDALKNQLVNHRNLLDQQEKLAERLQRELDQRLEKLNQNLVLAGRKVNELRSMLTDLRIARFLYILIPVITFAGVFYYSREFMAALVTTAAVEVISLLHERIAYARTTSSE